MRDFLIIANKNVITLKDVFPDIKNGIVKAGYTTPNNFLDGNGNITTTINGLCRWFTTMPVHKNNSLVLTKTYYGNEDNYPKYDNYDAINVGKVKDIPYDYDGVMGVPISYLERHCPEQFEIIDARTVAKNEKLKRKNTALIKDADGTINGKAKYARIMIRALFPRTKSKKDTK